MWAEGVYFLPGYLVLQTLFKKTWVNDHSIRGWLQTCLNVIIITCKASLSCNLTWRVYSRFLCQFFLFLPEEMVAIFFRNNSYSLYMKLSRVRLGSFEEYGKGVSSTILKLLWGCIDVTWKKTFQTMPSRFLGGAGIAVISLFNEGRKVKCISSRYSSLQRVIICIKFREI